MAKAFPSVNEVLHLRTTESTQTLARSMAEQGAAHGTLVWADRQSGGRGQFDRKWVSGPGGLYCSLIVRPGIAPRELGELSLATAGAVALALAGMTGLETRVKPPNDVYASNGKRSGKVCGVLIESSSAADAVDWVVIGVGVNVDNRPPLKTAASLKSLTGKTWNVERTLRAILDELSSTITPSGSKIV